MSLPASHGETIWKRDGRFSLLPLFREQYFYRH